MSKSAKDKPKRKIKWWQVPVGIVSFTLAAAIIYVCFIFITYYRIEDNQELDVEGTAIGNALAADTEYTALTYNIGFGAYTPDFTFFMDGGKQSWANSKESVEGCIEGGIKIIKDNYADLVMLQEVDTDATRSYHVDEARMITSACDKMSSTAANNFHSAFLFYPFYQPHGSSNSCILTLSDAQINSAVRRQLPISDGFSKILDYDRCYTVNRIKTGNGKELALYNTHLSAYGTNGDLQSQQLNMLFDDMKSEYEKGNYVICGGDYNHDFLGNSKEVFNKNIPDGLDWAAPFPDDLIPEHFSKVTDYKGGVKTPSCRNCDVPYGDDCFTVIVDGFIVSDNVKPTYAEVLDTQFKYSDHNPVIMKFKLA